jgi:hypothetical protein
MIRKVTQACRGCQQDKRCWKDKEMARMNFNQKKNSLTNNQAHQAPNFTKLHLEASNRRKKNDTF